MDNSFTSNYRSESSDEEPVDKNQNLNAPIGYPITEVLVGWKEKEKKKSLAADTEIKEYQVDQIERFQQMRAEIENYKEMVAKLTLELSEKNDISQVLQKYLPEHIYEVASKISNTTETTLSDVISRGLVLLELALLAKANGGEIIIFDDEGNPISNIEDLE